MTRKQRIKFWFSCKWDGIRSFFLLLKRLPGFYRLNRFWDCEPEFYRWVIQQYEEVMYEMTGGKLSKPSHSAQTVINEAWNYIDSLGKDEEEGETKE